MPKMRMAAVMPMYSVTRVSQLIDRQVEDREPAPERAEAVEDGLGVAALGDRAQPHGHLLDVVGHGHQDDEDPEQVEAVLAPVTA